MCRRRLRASQNGCCSRPLSFLEPPGVACPEAIAPQGVRFTLTGGNGAITFFDNGKVLTTRQTSGYGHKRRDRQVGPSQAAGERRAGFYAEHGRAAEQRLSGSTVFEFFPGDVGPGDVATEQDVPVYGQCAAALRRTRASGSLRFESRPGRWRTCARWMRVDPCWRSVELGRADDYSVGFRFECRGGAGDREASGGSGARIRLHGNHRVPAQGRRRRGTLRMRSGITSAAGCESRTLRGRAIASDAEARRAGRQPVTPALDERRSSALTPSSRPLSMEAGVSDGLVRRVAR